MSAQHTDHPAPAPKDDGLAWERCPEHGPDCRGWECPGARDHRPAIPPEKRWTERPGPHPADPPGFGERDDRRDRRAPDPRDARIAELEASVAFAQRENQRLAEAHAAEAARLRARGESLGRDLAASRAECGETERRLEEARHARKAAEQEAEGLRAKVKHLQTGLAFWRGAAVWESRGGAR